MTHFELLNSKIVTLEAFQAELARIRLMEKKIVFTNGCFDIIHRGHVEYLAKASDLGDLLILGLNTDRSVKEIKGPSRPINNEFSRALVLASLKYVDYVILFDEDTPIKLINFIMPDVLVKGGDYKPESIVGYEQVMANGGQVISIPFVEGFSSTNIIKKMNVIE